MTGKTFVEKYYKDFGRHFGHTVEQIARRELTETDAKKGWTTRSSGSGIIFKANGRTGMVQFVGVGRRNLGKIGTAKCSPSDKFNLKTGIAIAWARYNGVADIPDMSEPEEAPHSLITLLEEMTYGRHFRYQGKEYTFIEPSGFRNGNFVQKVKKGGVLGKIILLPDTTEVEPL